MSWALRLKIIGFSILFSNLAYGECLLRLETLALFKDPALSVTFHSQKIPIPIGMSPKIFKRLLSTIAAAPELKDASAVVLYGSRTHFTRGYGPKKGSDLDVVVFQHERVEITEAINRTDQFRTRLETLSKESEFPIHNEIYNLMNLSEGILGPEQNAFNFYSVQREIQLFQRLEGLKKTLMAEGVPEAEITSRLRVERGTLGINKEAIILLFKSDPVWRKSAADLLELGYSQVFVLGES